MSIFNPIRDLIREGKLKEALSTLAESLGQDINQKRKLDDDAILLNFKLRELERKESLNLISAELASQEKSQISMATLELLKRLDEAQETPSIVLPKTSSSSINLDSIKSKKWLLPALVILGLGLVIIILSSTGLLSGIGGTSGFAFVDEFNSSKPKSSWIIIEEDQSKWGMDKANGRLQIISQPGSIYGTNSNLKNQFILKKKLPKDNFEVVASVSYQIKEQFNETAIVLFQDDHNFMALRYFGNNISYSVKRTFGFTKEQNGKNNTIVAPGSIYNKDKEPRNIYFKIRRQGNDFISYYYSPSQFIPFENLDQIRWTEVGRHTWIDFKGSLSIWATNTARSINGATPESTAAFDFICVRSIPKEGEEVQASE